MKSYLDSLALVFETGLISACHFELALDGAAEKGSPGGVSRPEAVEAEGVL